MNSEFIQIQALEGELKISHKKMDFGATISTRELVLQKPHINYHIKLDDITSIIPFDTGDAKPLTFSHSRSSAKEVTQIPLGPQHYKFHVQKATVYNRNGSFEMGPSEFIMPLMIELLHIISRYGGMKPV